jgi:hypothetical protein
MKKFIFLRWLFALSLGIFLFGSSGYLNAQDNGIKKIPERRPVSADAQTQPISVEKLNAIGGSTFTVPSSGTRGTTNIKLQLSADGYYDECSFNLWSWDAMDYYWPSDQTFSYDFETITIILALEEGSSYDVDCWDSYGDGGIAGMISNDDTGWPITDWDDDDYTSYGDFNFVAGPGTAPIPPPANDLCVDAELISCGDVVNGNTDHATNTDAPDYCGTSFTTGPGVWYTFVGNGFPANISLCDSDFDTKVGVYTGTCGSLVCVEGNDDYCGTRSEVSFHSVNGETYYIYITGYSYSSGDYILSLSCALPGLEVINDGMDIGERPIGAWMKPASFEIINNPGLGDFSITDADIDETYGGFLMADKPQLPFVLESGETTYEFGIKNTEVGVAAGTFTGTFALFYGSERSVITATYSGEAYDPVDGDVWENAFDASSVSFPETVAQGDLRNNYELPGTNDDGWDAVYEVILTGDALVSASLTGTDAKMALYAQDFEGVGGPDFDNEIYSATTSATDLEVFAGVYYLVVSTTDIDYTLDVNVDLMPAPDVVTYLAPADGALDIINGNILEWTFGANTLEYQVVLGTTYPPTNVVVEWTADLATTYTLVDLAPSLQYFWQVNVRNNNDFTNGPVWGFTTTITPPSELEVTVVDGGVSETTVDADLEWVGSADRSLLGYNVYRDGVMINTIPLTGETFTDIGLDRDMIYSYYVTALFDEGESDPSNTVNIRTKGVGTANGIIRDFLSGDPIEGASVRVAGDEGDYVSTTNALGEYTTLAYGGTYSIIVTASGYTMQSIDGVVVTHDLIVSNDFNMMETPLPVGDVVAYELNDNEVKISWDGSGPELIADWFFYDNGFNNYNWWAGAGVPISWGISFDPIDLTGFDGTSLTKFAVYNTYASDVNTLYIYEGDHENGDATLIHTQELTGLTTSSWNEVELTVPVPLDVTKELWVTLYSPSPTGGVASGDIGTTNTKGDWLNDGTGWIHISDYSYASVFNMRIFATNAVEGNREIIPQTDLKYLENVSSEVSSVDMGESNMTPFRPQFADRGVLSYDVWREKVYQPGTMELVGNTTQMNFVDFDWGIQDWGVYRWAVTVNYEAGQTSPETYSNKLDKDMETIVSVLVTTNTGETAGGTNVTFTNLSEPALDLVYNTTLDNSGAFEWTDFRRGTYDIEVLLPGYYPITVDAYDIFEEESFEWFLEEILAKPAGLYVTPTAFATWQGGSAAPFTPFLETFDGLDNGDLPEGWTVSPDVTNWGAFDSDYAGGAAPEMRFNYSPFGTEEYYLKSPVMSTSGQTELNLSFKQFVNDFGSTHVTLKVLTIADGVEYIVDEWLVDGDIGPEALSYTLTAEQGVGADEFQLAFVMDGYTLYIDYWYIDDVMLNGARSSSGRSFETYKVFLDGVIAAEVTEGEYQYGTNGETLVDGETYTAEVVTVYTTGNSDPATFDFKYVACDNYATPTAFTAAQVEGTLDIELNWTNVDAAAVDTIAGVQIYRDGEEYAFVDFSIEVLNNYLDETLDFGTYSYCITYIYESGAETCQGVVCSGDVEIDGNAMVDGMVMQAAYLGGDPIEDAMVKLTDVLDPNITFTFYADANGAYGGDVIAGTYDYLVMAEGYVSQTLDDVVVALNATVTYNFDLTEFAFPAVGVVATELSDDVVHVTWHNPQYAPFEPVFENFDGGIPSSWTIEDDGTSADTWEGVSDLGGNDLDGTPFAAVSSDDAGIGPVLDEMLYSPVVNASIAEQLFLGFDQYYRHLGTGSYGIVEVFDGTDWVTVLNQTATVGAWGAPDQQMIDVSQYSNEFFQVRFHYFDNGSWSWYWAVDNVVITDAVTRLGEPVLTHNRSNDRDMTAYEIYRTTCVTGDLQLMGMVPATDSSFTDNTWGAATAGVYKWGVVVVYEENSSEPVFSNCIDKDMYTTVDVSVTTNSGDSPVDTDVTFTNISEPGLGLVYDVRLDETGFYEWTDFRKGTYEIYVEKTGFQPVMETAIIEGPESFAWILGEMLNPVADLYVTPTAYATWREGGPVPFEPYAYDFEADVQEWEIQNVVTGWQWGNNASLSSGFMNFNGNETNFIAVNADAEGSGGASIVAMAKSPLLNLANASEVYVTFDYTLNSDAIGLHYSVAGGDPVLVEDLDENAGSWINHTIALPEDALAADVQIIFLYEESGTWSYGGGIDNVVVTDVMPDRELEYYKVWLDGIFILDTENTFYQYDITNLVPGVDYKAEVAAMYSNGMSPKMEYVFTYIPCDSFPGPQNLTGEVIDLDDVLLTWGELAPPPPGGGWSEDFETGALGADWSVDQTNTATGGPVPSYFTVNDYASDDFAPFGSYHVGLWWDYGHQDEWLITPEFTCGTGDVLTFWTAVYEGSTNADHYYVKVSTDGGSTWTEEWDASTLSGNAWNYYNYSYTIDLAAYAGSDIKIAFNAVDGPGNDGLWYVWFLDNISVGSATRSIDFDPQSLVRMDKAENSDGFVISRDGNTNSVYENRPEVAKQLNYTDNDFTPSDFRSVTEFETCPEGSIYSYPLESVDWGVASSEAGPGYAVFQKFDGVGEPIGGVSFWGGNLIYDGGWSSCGSENPMTFEISFHEDDGGMPGAQVATFTKTITRDDTGIPISIYGNFYMYTTELDESVDLATGWISIVGQTASPDCWFMWAKTSDASATAYQQWNGTEYSTGDYGVSLCFAEGGTAPPPPGGNFDPGEFMGANIFRDGIMIAEMVQDTFYLDPDMNYGLYEYCVTFVYESGAESCLGSCVDVEVTEDCIAPVELEATLDQETYDAIYLNWNPSTEVEYRYDDGISTGQLGSSGGTTNTLLGNVHRVNTELTEMSWYLTAEGGPHSNISIWVLGLDAAGIPDGNNVLFTSSVSNTDEQWNTFTFNESLIVEGGFFLGVSYNGFAAIGTDDGSGDPYVFVPNTHYFVGDYTAGGWETWETYNFSVNGMIRATGMESSVASYVVEPTPKHEGESANLEFVGLDRAVVTGSPEWNNPVVSSTRAFTGYNIYRDDVLIEELWQENTYTDTEGLVDGNIYCYTVTALYSYCGESDPSNEACAGYIGIPEFDGSSVAIYPNPATSLVNITSSVEMTRITVTNYIGQVVYQSDLNDDTSVKLNTGSYENGVYVIRLDSESGVVTKRVIIAQ